jgi:hypothetical protein
VFRWAKQAKMVFLRVMKNKSWYVWSRFRVEDIIPTKLVESDYSNYIVLLSRIQY